MSYCRFSSDNWASEVYVYEDCGGGWTTHVAGRKRLLPPIPDFPLSWIPKFGAVWSRELLANEYPSRLHAWSARRAWRLWTLWHCRVHMPSVGLIPLRPIGLQHDGETFNDPTPGACAARLVALRALGYRVPQYAIDTLREEQAESDRAPG